ncbi:MAG: amino acid ABC transporter permease [Planctomycetota bacterium]|jgi:glutamate/aspartate transport system permease protein|nr:amino acid ABC transporter permease [Planctomycetota bacterium]
MGLNWGIFFEDAPFGGVKYYQWLLDGFANTALLFVSSWTMAFIVGSLVGILRTLPNRCLRALGTAYVEIFRNIPLLVQFFIWYAVIPELLPRSAGIWVKRIDPPVQSFLFSLVCLGFFTGGRIAEQVRSGIEALSKGQRKAGLALGMTMAQTYRHILMPNAYRIIMPPLTSESLNLIKNTAVASTIGLIDLTFQAYRLLDFSANSYESFIAITLAYVFLCLITLSIMRWIERRIRVAPTAPGRSRA